MEVSKKQSAHKANNDQVVRAKPEVNPMRKAVAYAKDNRPAMFDWMVFLGSFLLGFIFPSLSNFADSPVFAWWMLSALLLYLLGAYLKRLPLYYRMNKGGEQPEVPGFLLFLLLGHWIIMVFALFFSSTAIDYMLGGKGKLLENGVTVLLIMILAGFITWMVYHSKKFNRPKQYSDGFIFRRELVADICLLCSICFFSFVFWEKSIVEFLAASSPKTIAEIIMLFILLGLVYMLCYLPLRYLFLVEDHHHRATWQRMFFIFFLILIRTLLHALGM
jgi:hypothetical protein